MEATSLPLKKTFINDQSLFQLFRLAGVLFFIVAIESYEFEMITSTQFYFANEMRSRRVFRHPVFFRKKWKYF